MSSPAPPRTPGAVHPTRQQLDELEAMLQRMLDLPTDPVGAEPAAPGESSVPPRPVTYAVETYQPLPGFPPPAPPTDRQAVGGDDAIATQVDVVGSVFPPLEAASPSPSPVVDEGRDGEVAGSWGGEVVPAASAPPHHPAGPPGGREPKPPAWMQALANPLRPTRRRGSPMAVLRWPLVCVNRLFDWWLGWLGPLGRPLRGDRGRNLLGWTGVVLLAGALAWLLLGGTPWTR